MKDKNKKLIIVVASLFLVIGVSFAYFTVSVLLDGKGASTSGTTATLGSSELKVEGSLSFSDLDIYPGHQNVSSIKVSATGENELIPYHVIWEGENTLNTTLKYYVYKVEQEVEVKTTCEKKNGIKDGAKTYYEECSISNESELGSIISSGEIKTGETKKRIITDEFITSSKEGEEVYYYVILEYPNNNENQNRDIGGSFKGEVTVEINDITPDISIIATYIEENGGYKEVSEIPREGYELNEEKSSCNNNAKLGWDKENSRIYVEKLNKSGTECILYYDEYVSAKDTILADKEIKIRNLPFTTSTIVTDTTTGVIYKAEDDWGDTYYFAGNPQDNWVKFAGYYWRIIRINGDGSIRLIYNGTGTVTTGSSTMINSSQAFNSSYNRSEYVGYMYASGQQHGNTTDSSIKDVLDSWYGSNLASQADKISKEAGFCGDKEMASGSWNSTGSTHYYAGYGRLVQNGNSVNPTFKCSNSSGNGSYYLYNNANYWTISPHRFTSTGYAYTFRVHSGGNLGYTNVNDTSGVRPVINIASDVTIRSGNGTSSTPYEI